MTGAQLPDHAFALPDAELLAITGPDASTFAQAQFTNDVDALADGQWHWNGWLDAKGRLQALFGLLREDDQRLLAWLPAGGAGTLAVALSRFRFRSKVQIQPDTARTLVAVRGEASPGPGVLPLPADAQLGPTGITHAVPPRITEASSFSGALPSTKSRTRGSSAFASSLGVPEKMTVPSWIIAMRLLTRKALGMSWVTTTLVISAGFLLG